MKTGDEKIMKDGSKAYLTQSERYFVRREPDKDNWTKIEYYTLEGEYIPLAKATCPECKETIQSQHCGDFVQCSCGKSFVDTDRWMPERQRYGGGAIDSMSK